MRLVIALWMTSTMTACCPKYNVGPSPPIPLAHKGADYALTIDLVSYGTLLGLLKGKAGSYQSFLINKSAPPSSVPIVPGLTLICKTIPSGYRRIPWSAWIGVDIEAPLRKEDVRKIPEFVFCELGDDVIEVRFVVPAAMASFDITTVDPPTTVPP